MSNAVTTNTNVETNWRYRSMRWARWVIPLGALSCLGASCDVSTIFSANFESDVIGSPPAAAQTTGTVRVEKGGGSVTAVASPAPDTRPGTWVRVSHPTASSSETSFLVDATQSAGEGSTTLLASLFIPSPGPRPNPNVARALATVQFERALGNGQAPSYMHLDFMDTGVVRIDDLGSSSFGSFPFDQPFNLSVSTQVSATDATARISLLSPASGQVDHPVSFVNVARDFNSVRFWVGFQFASTFFVDDISILHSPPG